MEDGINTGDESDRLLIRWRLDSQKAEAAAAGELAEPHIDKLREWGSTPILSAGPRGGPVVQSSSARVLICQVPHDVVALRHGEPGQAREWRIARSEQHTSELQSHLNLVCRLLLEKKKQ